MNSVEFKKEWEQNPNSHIQKTYDKLLQEIKDLEEKLQLAYRKIERLENDR